MGKFKEDYNGLHSCKVMMLKNYRLLCANNIDNDNDNDSDSDKDNDNEDNNKNNHKLCF